MHSLVQGCKSDPTSNLKYLQTIQEKGAKLLGPPHHVRLQYYPLSIRPAVVIGPVPQWTRSQQSWQSHSKRWQKHMMACQQRHMSKWKQLNDRNPLGPNWCVSPPGFNCRPHLLCSSCQKLPTVLSKTTIDKSCLLSVLAFIPIKAMQASQAPANKWWFSSKKAV